MKKGDVVEVSGDRGTVAFVKAGVAYVRMDRSLHFMDTPDSLSLDSITRNMAEPSTDRLGYGTVEFLKNIGKLPAGTFTKDDRSYILKKPMKLAALEELCMETYPNEPHCWLQGAYLNVVPIKV